MTAITIDRTLLVRMEKELFLARNYGGILRDEPLLNEVSAALSAPATAPAWHDAPTCAGVWLCDEGDICYTWTAHNIEILDRFDPGDGLRWFGPIPPDGDKP